MVGSGYRPDIAINRYKIVRNDDELEMRLLRLFLCTYKHSVKSYGKSCKTSKISNNSD